MKVLDIINETAPVANPLPEADVIANWLKNNPHLEVVEKYDPKAANFASKRIAENKFQNAQIIDGFQTRYGAGFTFLKALGIIGPMVLCVMHLRALDAQAKEVNDLEWIKRQENAIVGTFLASQIARLIYTSVRSGVFIGALRQLLTAIAMRTPGGGRAVILALIAEQVALAALQTWLNTTEGLEWCTHGLVMPLIVGGLGSVGNSTIDFLRKKIKDTTGKDIGQVTPNINKQKDAAAADNDGPSSDEIAKWQADSEKATNPIQKVIR